MSWTPKQKPEPSKREYNEKPRYSIQLPCESSQKTVVLSHNSTWSQREKMTWTKSIDGVPAPTDDILTNFEEKFTAVSMAFYEFGESGYDCLANFLISKDTTGNSAYTLPHPHDAIGCPPFLLKTRFFGHEITFQSDHHSFTMNVLGHDFTLQSITPAIEHMHIGFLCCEGGMVYFVDAMYRLLKMMENIPDCFGEPLYSWRHDLESTQPSGFRSHTCRCTRCFLAGSIGLIDQEARSISPDLWQGLPASQPPAGGSSPLLLSLNALEHLFWGFIPFQLGKLMCTCHTLHDFLMTAKSQWKSYILGSRPFLMNHYDEMVSVWGVSLPKLCTKILSLPEFKGHTIVPTISDKPVRGYVQRIKPDEFRCLTIDRYKSLFFLNKAEALEFYEVSCFDWCQICLKEIVDDSKCSRHQGTLKYSADEYGTDTWWTCCDD